MSKIAIVGGGLVGSMTSCFLARKGYDIVLYEMREDPRTLEHVPGKSINLAISERGRSALRSLGLETQLINNYAIPMRGRLIHHVNGKRHAIPYGREGQCIMSVSRQFLNELLLSEAEKHPNVTINFQHKLISCKFESTPSLTFTRTDNSQKIIDTADVIIGCDGAYSNVRKEMQKCVRFDYSQRYIEHGYIELCIPPDGNGQYAMEVNYLHIWPRGTFMMIALPNLDRSYTVTLFMSFKQFDQIKTPQQLMQFFQMHFPDSIELIGSKSLITTFFNSRPSPLVSIKCSPYHYEDKVLLMGDAAHAMVPFYGQGMNCGFEDCLILDELLCNYNNSIGNVLPLYTDVRVENCKTIVDLAMYNYIEMRHLVNSWSFLMRKKFDFILNRLFPNSWIPLYSMVTFTRIPYKDCMIYRQWQDNVISKCRKIGIFVTIGIVAHYLIRNLKFKMNGNGISIDFN